MTNTFKTAKDLASAICTAVHAMYNQCPPLSCVLSLIETMFYTSMKTEEGQAIQCHMVWLNPDEASKPQEKDMFAHAWNFVRLDEPLRLDVHALTKIARATDPRTSSLVVFPDRHNELKIWGLVDQVSRYHEYLHHNASFKELEMPPGVFQAGINGVGHISAYICLNRIAELKAGCLILDSHDVMKSGPVRKNLDPGIADHIQAVLSTVDATGFNGTDDITTTLTTQWSSTVCKLLLRIQQYRHGGAILITPGAAMSYLNPKYRLGYDRIRVSLNSFMKHSIHEYNASKHILKDYLEKHVEQMPVMPYLDEWYHGRNTQIASVELNSAIWFVSLLSRVDGLVLLSPHLEVKAFGVEVTVKDDPNAFLAVDVEGNVAQEQPLDLSLFGMRHRSMMRYCGKVEGSVGFVISQDGTVSVMTSEGNRLLVWNNVRLRQESTFPQLPDYLLHR